MRRKLNYLSIKNVRSIRLKSIRILYNDLTIPREEPSIKDVDIIFMHIARTRSSQGTRLNKESTVCLLILQTKCTREAMLKVVHDDKLAKEMRRNGRKDVFSWRKIAARSIQLYIGSGG